MKHYRVLAVLVLAISLGATACGNQGPTATTATTPSATSSPTPSIKTSTPQQLASVVAEHKAAVEQLKLDPDCSLYERMAEGNPKALMENLKSFNCSTGKGTHAIRAEILVTQLGKLSPYPTDMESLVADTVTKAKNLAAVKVNDSCTSTSSLTEACRTARLSYSLMAPSLAATLAGWKPYGA